MYIISAPNYKIKTQSELIELFNRQEEVEKEFNSMKQEYDLMWNQYCKPLHDQLDVLAGKKKSSKTVSYVYLDHPIRRYQSEFGLTISEPMSSHKRYAIWHNTNNESVYDLRDTGVFCDGGKEEWYFYNEEQFLNHANDWVVSGKLPENGYIA
jgi:hypothetical protein